MIKKALKSREVERENKEETDEAQTETGKGGEGQKEGEEQEAQQEQENHLQAQVLNQQRKGIQKVYRRLLIFFIYSTHSSVNLLYSGRLNSMS